MRDCFVLLVHILITRCPARQARRAAARPGPKGPAKELITAVLEMKQRNPSWGVPANRAAGRISVRRGNRQGCGSPDLGAVLSTRLGRRESLVAQLSRPHER